jgi:hypothetical protein
MTKNNENLNELFSAFLDADSAEQAAGDIRKGDEILTSHSEPDLDSNAIANLKSDMRSQLSRRRVRKIALQRTAAAIVIIASVSAVFISKTYGPAQPLTATASIWQDKTDEQVALLTEQIGDIETEMSIIRLGADGNGDGFDLTEIETEIDDINGNFWKG